MNTTKVFDLIGIGIGPFNLGLAALCDELPGLDCLFIEKQPEFNWHPGMMIPGTRLQVPFYADLVTLTNPRSRFTYLNYLHEQQQMITFGVHEQQFITRKEFNNYCRWVCSLLPNLHFSETCLEIEPGLHGYKVITDRGTYYAAHIVVGAGSVPYIPACVKELHPHRLIHTSDYLFHKKHITQLPSVTIVGSGQSAAEVFYDLLSDRENFTAGLSWFTSSERFFPMDYSKFSLELSSPSYVDYFYSLPPTVRLPLLKNQKMLYKGINFNLIDEIYDKLYLQRIEDITSPVHISANCLLKDISCKTNEIVCDFEQTQKQQVFQHCTDTLILATGYQTVVPDFLTPLKKQLRLTLDGKNYNANRNYSIDDNNSVFIQNAEWRTHGFNTADLGLGPYRNATILNGILNKEHFKLEKGTAFQSFGIK